MSAVHIHNLFREGFLLMLEGTKVAVQAPSQCRLLNVLPLQLFVIEMLRPQEVVLLLKRSHRFMEGLRQEFGVV
jgi:hypothetical protein